MGIIDLMEKELFLEQVNESKKFCTDCKTTKTPLWRGGPSGPKSLCNACGIRYRKRRISMVGMGIAGMRRGSENGSEKTGTFSKSDETDWTSPGDEPLKERIMGFGKVIMVKKSGSVLKKLRCQRKRKLGEEEEEAAVSLMALSCDSVFG